MEMQIKTALSEWQTWKHLSERQYPSWDTVVLFAKMLPLGETRLKVKGMCLYYFLQLSIILKLSQEELALKKLPK